MVQADRDEGRRSDGLTTAEREELVRLRRELRVAKLEVEILKRAQSARVQGVLALFGSAVEAGVEQEVGHGASEPGSG